MTNIKRAFFIFPVLFAIEMIFGFSGTMLMVGEIAIRHILFILTFLSLYIYCGIYIFKNKIPVFSRAKDSLFGSFRLLDWCAVIFEASMLLSMTVIPYFMGTDMHLARSEAFDSAAVFSLFFPLSFLIRRKEISVKKMLSFLNISILIFALMHIVFYIGQTVSVTFIVDIFDGINKLFAGNSIAPTVVLGHGGYPRVMFNTSVYLIVGLYINFRNLPHYRIFDYIVFIVDTLAILATITKSLWFGIIVAAAIAIVLSLVYNIFKNNDKVQGKAISLRIIICSVLALVTIVVSNYTIFDNMVFIRMGNAFTTSAASSSSSSKSSGSSSSKSSGSSSSSKKKLAQLDKSGAALSNKIKIEQSKKLIEKWTKSPIFGFGYGSYIKDYLRSKEAPFSYEMQAFALLMKVGIVGIAVWILFIVVQLAAMIKKRKAHINSLFPWLFLLIAFGLCVQTNPLLISFTGMSVVLIISLMTVYETSINDEGENTYE